MSAEFDQLSQRIERLHDAHGGVFDVVRILLDLMIDTGLVTVDDAKERLQAHIDDIAADRPERDKTYALRMLLELNRKRKSPSHARTPPRPRPALRVVEQDQGAPDKAPTRTET
jgi:hypothetical protein